MGIRVQGLNYKLKMFSLKEPHHTRDLILSQFSVDCCQYAFASGALHRTPLGGFQRPPDPQLGRIVHPEKSVTYFFSPNDMPVSIIGLTLKHCLSQWEVHIRGMRLILI